VSRGGRPDRPRDGSALKVSSIEFTMPYAAQLRILQREPALRLSTGRSAPASSFESAEPTYRCARGAKRGAHMRLTRNVCP